MSAGPTGGKAACAIKPLSAASGNTYGSPTITRDLREAGCVICPTAREGWSSSGASAEAPLPEVTVLREGRTIADALPWLSTPHR